MKLDKLGKLDNSVYIPVSLWIFGWIPSSSSLSFFETYQWNLCLTSCKLILSEIEFPADKFRPTKFGRQVRLTNPADGSGQWISSQVTLFNEIFSLSLNQDVFLFQSFEINQNLEFQNESAAQSLFTMKSLFFPLSVLLFWQLKIHSQIFLANYQQIWELTFKFSFENINESENLHGKLETSHSNLLWKLSMNQRIHIQIFCGNFSLAALNP